MKIDKIIAGYMLREDTAVSVSEFRWFVDRFNIHNFSLPDDIVIEDRGSFVNRIRAVEHNTEILRVSPPSNKKSMYVLCCGLNFIAKYKGYSKFLTDLDTKALIEDYVDKDIDLIVENNHELSNNFTIGYFDNLIKVIVDGRIVNYLTYVINGNDLSIDDVGNEDYCRELDEGLEFFKRLNNLSEVR